mmetsp:Transcript_22618/g.63093  ORF Transcript_22618/g.63093 Transcript_22618/m.63093 type:complete len:231 (+) Transcript_22618:192-884(+)
MVSFVLGFACVVCSSCTMGANVPYRWHRARFIYSSRGSANALLKVGVEELGFLATLQDHHWQMQGTRLHGGVTIGRAHGSQLLLLVGTSPNPDVQLPTAVEEEHVVVIEIGLLEARHDGGSLLDGTASGHLVQRLGGITVNAVQDGGEFLNFRIIILVRSDGALAEEFPELPVLFVAAALIQRGDCAHGAHVLRPRGASRLLERLGALSMPAPDLAIAAEEDEGVTLVEG